MAASLGLVSGPGGWFGASLAVVAFAIAAVDAKSFIIPNWLNATAFSLGLVNWLSVAADPVSAAAFALCRSVVMALLFWSVRIGFYKLRGRHGLGLGDVKLAAVAGCWLDWPILPVAVEIAAVSALLTFAARHYLLRRPVRRTTRMPFGLFLGPAIWIAWLLQATLVDRW